MSPREIAFVRSWKPLAFRGCAGLLFGVVVLLWPGMTLSSLVLLFGAYSAVDGVLAIAASTRQKAVEDAWSLALEGFIGIGVGFATYAWTGITTVVLVQLIAAWAMLTGALEVAAAVRLRRDIPGEVLLGLGGMASVSLGVLLLFWPSAGAFVILVLLGSYAFFFGASMLVLALRLRRLTGRFTPFHGLGPPHHDAA